MHKRVLGVLVLFLSLLFTATAEMPRPKYVFLFIGDGMGDKQLEAADWVLTRSGGEKLSFRTFPVSGKQRTASLSNGTTDSAAAATALACGRRTQNGMLGLSASNQPLPSLAAQAHDRGWKVGIVTSVSVDHATPAAFYAHARSRGSLSDIAAAMAQTPFDFFGGGGLAGQKNEASAPGDDNLQRAISNGFVVVRTRETLQALQPSQKVFAFNHRLSDGATLPWALDAQADDIRLAEFTAAAIRQLEDKPFFLMVEGGKIDNACHANDLISMAREIEAFDQAVRVAAAFAARHPDETLIVVTADHETGGLARLEGDPGRTNYVPKQVMAGATFISRLKESMKDNAAPIDILARTTEAFGIADFSKEEQDQILQNWNEPLPKGDKKDPYANVGPVTEVILSFVAARCGYYFNTLDHTGTEVSVHASGAGAPSFSGLYDNTGVYDRLHGLMFPEKAPAAKPSP